jgi:hypothetical protein
MKNYISISCHDGEVLVLMDREIAGKALEAGLFYYSRSGYMSDFSKKELADKLTDLSNPDKLPMCSPLPWNRYDPQYFEEAKNFSPADGRLLFALTKIIKQLADHTDQNPVLLAERMADNATIVQLHKSLVRHHAECIVLWRNYSDKGSDSDHFQATQKALKEIIP